jgi:hypothetical protein
MESGARLCFGQAGRSALQVLEHLFARSRVPLNDCGRRLDRLGGNAHRALSTYQGRCVEA